MLSEIARLEPDLGRAEGRVARWLLEHPHEASRARLADVARAAGASEPTVIRFCRRLGLDGFRDLGRRLTESLSDPGSVVHRDVDPGDSATVAAVKVLDSTVHALMAVRRGIDGMPFDAAVAKLAGARQITFGGHGASGLVAADAAHKFFRLGIPCAVADDEPGLLQSSAIAESDDVFVLLSASGRWPAMLKAARVAVARGATTIAVTRAGSPLAELGLTFAADVAEDTGVYTPMRSRIAQLAILDALQVALALALGEPASERLRATKRALADMAADMATDMATDMAAAAAPGSAQH